MTSLHPSRRGLAAPWVVLAILVGAFQAGPSSLGAQIVGRVVDSETGDPVPTVGVALLDAQGTVHAQVVSNEVGRFIMVPVAGPGEYQVQVVALGYVDVPSEPLRYNGEATTVEILLDPAPIGMAGIEVTVEALDPALEAQGFYHRRRFSSGYFLSPEELEERTFVRSSEVLRRLPGVEVRDGEPRFTRRVAVAGGAGCLPDIWLDGIPMRWGGRSGRVLDQFDLVLPAPGDIAAVEVYPGPTSVPPQFRTLTAGCGVIAVWTKR
ncbi:MAG: carboxypeptidase regulatory-like domain-containing protein [Gemmatimonadota bacterium]